MDDFDRLQIRKLDGGLLLVFSELLARRRATEVARHLGLSQSAISHALTRLRDVFSDPLFIRRSHGLEPTKRALELGPRIEALIDLIGVAVSPGGRFDPARSRRRFAIAAPDAIASLIGDRLLEAFRAQAPQAIFTTRPVVLDRALAAVRRGEIDLAIGVFDAVPPDLAATPLYGDEYCVIARADHPRIKGEVDLTTYATIGHIFVGTPDGALSDEAPLDRKQMDATYGALPSPQLVRTNSYVSQWETAMLMVSQTDALADCPRRLATRFAKSFGLQVLDPPFERFKFAVQGVRRGVTNDPGAAWLLEQVCAATAEAA